MKSIKAQTYVSVVCVVLGLMLAYQFKAVKKFTGFVTSPKVDELSNQLEAVKQQKSELQKKIDELEKKNEEFEQGAASTSFAVNELKNELEKSKLLAGLTDVQGPGVTITVTPESSQVDQELNIQGQNQLMLPENYHVSLLLIINELYSSGAEAVMINDQRIISTTQIRDAGDFVIINDIKHIPSEKFEIKAIGNPGALEQSLNFVKDMMFQYYGLDIKIQRFNNIKITKYNKVINFEYAKIQKEGE